MMPTEDIFELAKIDVAEPKEGEFLVRNILDVCGPLYAWTDEEVQKKLKATSLHFN
jgi:NADPH-dependent curcumin reductase CurA